MNKPSPNAVVLGDFIAANAQRTLPEPVLNTARLCFSDWLSVAIGAGEEAAGRIVRKQVAAMHSRGDSSVLYGGTAAPALAALANGTLAHCLDFDDTYIGANTHTSAPVWAATLALGEAIDADEAAMLAAFVTGFEVAAQVGRGVGQAVTARGLHATGVFGRIGAAAAAAALLGLDAQRAAHALAAAATQSSGLTASFGSMAKPFHAGKAAMDGVLSAQLAADGFEAAPGVLEAGGGLDRAIIQDGSLQLAASSFSQWEILNNSFKPYAACHLTHPTIDAARALSLSSERPIDPTQIHAARVRVSELAQQITGMTQGPPATPLAAKFDLRYCTALGLHGHSVSATDFPTPWTVDAKIAATAAIVESTADASVDFAAARLELEMKDGRIEIIDIEVAKGHPGNPIDWHDMRVKFDGLVEGRIGAHADRLFGVLSNFGAPGGLHQIKDVVSTLA
ncbi:MAG: 2-methylcitrate dehydratase PrpD [Gammaproteobacteria bacterium]|jgi:2-methylcitrate dehydratase PrpD